MNGGMGIAAKEVGRMKRDAIPSGLEQWLTISANAQMGQRSAQGDQEIQRIADGRQGRGCRGGEVRNLETGGEDFGRGNSTGADRTGSGEGHKGINEAWCTTTGRVQWGITGVAMDGEVGLYDMICMKCRLGQKRKYDRFVLLRCHRFC